MNHIGRNHVDFTTADESAIVQMLLKQMSLKEVALKMDCGVKPIIRIARKHQVKLSRGRSAFTEEQEQEILILIEQQIPLPEIAQRYGRNVKSVARVARLRGIQPDARAFRPSEEESAQLIARYLAGGSFQQMAKDMHISGHSLRKHLIEKGVAIRLNRTSKAKEDLICHDYIHSGLNIEELSRKHVVTDKVVRRLIQERRLVRLVEPVYICPFERMGKRSAYRIWVDKYGQKEADHRAELHRQRCSARSSGKNNPMYGKPAPQGSGNGWKGWYKGTFFRSLREVSFIMNELEKTGVQWINGEKGEYRSKYIDGLGRERTYCPDYIVLSTQTMYEIKPKRLWTTPTITAKRLAGEAKCRELGLKYELIDPPIDGAQILEGYKKGDIKWQGKTEDKFLAYYELTKPVVTSN